MTTESIQAMTDQELARWQAGWKEHTDNFILAEQEWGRRHMQRKHDLNLEILERQKEMTKVSVTLSVMATIIGAILGAILTAVF